MCIAPKIKKPTEDTISEDNMDGPCEKEDDNTELNTDFNSTMNMEALESEFEENTEVAQAPKKKKKKKKLKGYFLDNSYEWLVKTMKDDDGNYTEVRVCRAVLIKETRFNMDTGEITCIIGYRLKNNEWMEREIPREMLDKQKFNQLLKFGVDIVGNKLQHVINFIDQEEEFSSFVTVHTSLGWGMYKDKTIFKHYEAIGYESSYVGKLNIKPHGTLEGWLSIINKYVIGNTYLELALIMGLSAAVVSLLRKHTLIDVLLFHLYGNSTEGKTTATRVAVSSFGYPHLKENGLIKTFASTSNAMLANLKDNYGIPIGIDESSIQTGEDFTRFIYTVVNGRDKDRMNSGSEIKDTAEFSTSVITNGEHSLIAKSNQNIGLKMRAFEFGNVRWTESAESADALSDGLMDEYGTSGPVFAEYLMINGENFVIKKWETWCQKCLDAMPKIDKFSPRIARKIALVMVTAELASDCFSINLNLEEMLNAQLSVEKENIETRDIGENAYQFLKEEFLRNESSFFRVGLEDFGKSKFGQCLGKAIYKDKKLVELLMTNSVLTEKLKAGGFQDTNIILQKWKEKGYLDCDNGKFTRKRRIEEIGTIRVHVIKIVDFDAPCDDGSEVEDKRQIIRRNAIADNKRGDSMGKLFEE